MRLPVALIWMSLMPGLLAPGCTRGVDEARLRTDLQTRLDEKVKPGLFKVVGVRREGSAPLPAATSGASRVVVYFNSTLQLVQDYGFGGWDQLGPSSVAFALGATEKGISGFQPQSKAGDTVRAYSSAIYEETPDGWTLVDSTVTAAAKAPDYEGTAPPPRSKQLIDRLAAMVEIPPPGVTPSDDEIIADELARASENIERRVQRRSRTFTLATGPAGGEYAAFGTSLIAAINAVAPAVTLRQRNSDGSVENVLLLARDDADYAIVQGDVAAAAWTGGGVFLHGGKFDQLRAVGSLFPEAVHVIVRSDSPIHDVSQLKGRRVDVGAPSSGTRFDAVAVLEAYGLTPDDLAHTPQNGPGGAVDRLRSGQIDAMFATSAAPARGLQELAVDPGVRLLSLKDSAVAAIARAHKGLTPLTLPAHTYPKQPQPVTTVASSALLVTTTDAPEAEVRRVADLVFARKPAEATGPVGTSGILKVSTDNDRRGITIPLHPGAERAP